MLGAGFRHERSVKHQLNVESVQDCQERRQADGGLPFLDVGDRGLADLGKLGQRALTQPLRSR